jgi:hypothetical protein
MMGVEMTDTQILTIAMRTAPTMLIVLVGILINNARLGDLSSSLNARLGDLGNNFSSRFTDLNTRIGETNARIGETNIRIGELRSHMDVRFEEMKDLWRSELHRVEEVIDARLKHIER